MRRLLPPRHVGSAILAAVFLCVPITLPAQRGRGAAEPVGAGRAELEIVADSIGQPIRVNGRQVGVTPATLRLPAAAGVRVEVGAGSRLRALTVDLPAEGRLRIDVTMPRDTVPVPVLLTDDELLRRLTPTRPFATREAPARPVRPEPPRFRPSWMSGLLVGGVVAAASGASCGSGACILQWGAGTAIGASLGFHQLRRLAFRRASRSYGAADAAWQVAELRYREESASRDDAMRGALERARAEQFARRRDALATNERILRANRELPVVSLLNAPGVRVTGARTQLVPPSLRIAAFAFEDGDGDSVVAAGETASVRVRIINAGTGAAQAVRVGARPGAGLRLSPALVGAIPPGETRELRVAFSADAEVADGVAELELLALESNGFDSDPFLLRVPTMAYRAPDLGVADVGVRDPNGQPLITPGVPVELTLRVANRGGPAEDVVVVLDRGDSTLLFTRAVDRPTVVLEVGRLGAGEYRDVTIEVIANRRATGVPLQATVAEASGRFGSASRDLGLTLRVPQRSPSQLLEVPRSQVTGIPLPVPMPGSMSPTTAGAAVPPATLGASLLARIPEARRINPDAFAVIIGNRTYRNAPAVNFAANDAGAMRQYAERALGIRPGNIFELPDATKSTLEDFFGIQGNPNGRLKELVVPGRSEVFVFYSGHGAPDPQVERAYLMPVDANANRLSITGYSLDLLYENLAALEAKHVTVVLDACFSGGTVEGGMLISSASPIGIRVNDPSARFAGRNGTVIAAATGQQLANWYPEQGHGLLTYFFLKGLQGSADTDGDGRVSVGEMKMWLQDGQGLAYEARRLFGREQLPQVWGDERRVLRP